MLIMIKKTAVLAPSQEFAQQFWFNSRLPKNRNHELVLPASHGSD
jgi:hypothetical protein